MTPKRGMVCPSILPYRLTLGSRKQSCATLRTKLPYGNEELQIQGSWTFSTAKISISPSQIGLWMTWGVLWETKSNSCSWMTLIWGQQSTQSQAELLSWRRRPSSVPPLTQVSQKPLHGSRPNFVLPIRNMIPDRLCLFQNFWFSNFNFFFFFRFP